MQGVSNFPKYVLWGLLCVTLVFAGIFFFGPSESYVFNGSKFDAPSLTSGFLILAVAFIIIAAVVTLVSAAVTFGSRLVYDRKKVMVPLIAVLILAVLFLITYFGADTTKLNITGYEGSHDAWVYRITNMCMVSSFVLAAIAFLSAIASSFIKKL